MDKIKKNVFINETNNKTLEYENVEDIEVIDKNEFNNYFSNKYKEFICKTVSVSLLLCGTGLLATKLYNYYKKN
jgi:hypothetical protein